MIRTITMVMGMLFTASSFCQPLPCSWWPATCPMTSSINEAKDIVSRTNNKFTLPQEIELQAKVRNKLTDEMQRMARQKGWRVYELNENSLDGPPYIFISWDAWQATPYSKRPPKRLFIQYVIVVNKDSLNSWRDWTINDLMPKANSIAEQYANDYRQKENDPLLKGYYDSLNQLTSSYGKFLQDHSAQYEKDLKEKNQQGIKEHDRLVQGYHKQMDLWEKKIEDRNSSLFDKSGDPVKDMQQEAKEKTAAFAEASIVLVDFTVNPYNIGSSLRDGEQRSLIPQTKLNIDGASYAGLLHNTLPYNEFHAPDDKGYEVAHPSSVAFILFGKFTKPDTYNNYHSLFSANYGTKQEVIGTDKAIPCDVVQTIGLHLKGRQDKVREVLSAFDMTLLEKMVLQKP